MSEKFKRDFGKEVVDLKGKAIQQGMTLHAVMSALMTLPEDAQKQVDKAIGEAVKKPLTLAEASIAALTAHYEDEKTLEGSERMKRFQLALRVNKSGMVKINSEERDKIKRLIYKHYGGSVIGPVCDMLLEGADPLAVEAEEAEDA